MTRPLTDPEVIHMTISHEKLVTWERAFAGWPGKLTITQCPTWTYVTLRVDPDARMKIEEVDIEVLRQIVAMADGLPPHPGPGTNAARGAKGERT